MSDIDAEVVKRDLHCKSSWQGNCRRVGADVGGGSMESRSVFQTLRIPSVIGQERRTSVAVIRRTDKLLCGGFKWVSRFDMRCIPTW